MSGFKTARVGVCTISTHETLLGAAALLAVFATVPFVAGALSYRSRDNGLSYLFFVGGVGFWNGMTVAQLLSPDPQITSFYLSLSLVGGLLAGLGWFLFAATASRTPAIPNRTQVFGLIAALVGTDIGFAIIAPTHTLYWDLPAGVGRTPDFARISPNAGLWLHTALLAGLFLFGAALFAIAWRAGEGGRYSIAYTGVASATALAVLAGAVFVPGGETVAPHLAAALAGIGWVQAQRGRVLDSLRAVLGSM